MKKSVGILLILLVLLSLAACGEDPPASQRSTPLAEVPTTKTTAPTVVLDETVLEGKTLSDYLVEEDGKYYLILPASGEKIYLRNAEDDMYYLNGINLLLLAAAELKIKSQMEQYNTEYYFCVYVIDGVVWLNAEAIVDIDPPNGEGGGCGIDHEHIFLKEKIST